MTDTSSLQIAFIGINEITFPLTEFLIRGGKRVHLFSPQSPLPPSGSDLIYGRNYGDELIFVEKYDIFASGEWIIFITASSREFEDIQERLMPQLNADRRYHFVLFTHGIPSKSLRKKSGCLTLGALLKHKIQTAGLKRTAVSVVTLPGAVSEIFNKHIFFTAGSEDDSSFKELDLLFKEGNIHLDRSSDPLTVELAGILLAPLQIGFGIAEGLSGCGKSFLSEMARIGFFEMSRLAESMDGRIETLLGSAGFSRLLAAVLYPDETNRSYGNRFIRRLNSGEDDPTLIERFAIFFNPAGYLEEDMLDSHFNAEGVYALSSLIELAKDRGIAVPVYEKIYSILARKSSPDSLVEVVTGKSSGELSMSSAVSNKRQGISRAKGINFAEVLKVNIYNGIINTPGLISRIIRQTDPLIESLKKRIDKAERSNFRSDLVSIPIEISMWQAMKAASAGEERTCIQKLIEFYVKEISDNYLPLVQTSMLSVGIPVRFMAGRFLPGSSLPDIGGNLKKIKHLSKLYNILYTPTHRTHLDSVELSMALHWLGLPIPRYAAGHVLMSGPVKSWLLKSLGAYSVDRERTRNILYLECLKVYARTLLAEGIPSLVYPEGTRSRTGKILPIKTGLITSAVEAFLESGREIIVLPVTISHENVPEDFEFLKEKSSTSFKDFLSKRSRVYLDFCEPIRVSAHINSESPILSIGTKIVNEWKRHYRILPNQLVARVLYENRSSSISQNNLTELCDSFMMRNTGNYLYRDPEQMMKRGVKVLSRRDFISLERSEIYPKAAAMLEYYGNMIPITDEIEEVAENSVE